MDLPGAGAELLRATYRRVVEAGPGCPVAAPRHDGRWHPLAATWMPEARGSLEEWLASGRRDLQGLLERLPAAALEGEALAALGEPSRLLENVNTQSELDRARAIRRRTSPVDRRGRE